MSIRPFVSAKSPTTCMLSLPLFGVGLVYCSLAAAEGSSAPTTLSPISVKGEFESSPYAVPLHSAVPSPDAAELLNRAPGAHVNRNGSLSGIVQYRGLFGDRINVSVDGLTIAPSCSNAMDTPLSHAPTAQLQTLDLIRGIAPVSSALESLGGQVRASMRNGEFASSEDFETQIEASLETAEVNRSAAASVLTARANERHKLYADLSFETGDDSAFRNGEIRPNGYRRERYAAGYAQRSAKGTWSLDLARNQTGDSGSPSLPMDILFADNNVAVFDIHRNDTPLAWHVKLGYSSTEHAMTNFTLRDAPSGKTRRSDTEADSLSYRLETTWDAMNGELSLGTDGQFASHDASISNPNQTMFSVDNFNAVERDLIGLFAEWQGPIPAKWHAQLGARVNQAKMNAGRVRHSMSMMNPAIAQLQQDFNSADRSQSDTHIDWAIHLDRPFGRHQKLIIGAARKTRSPSYQERYLWIPLEATAGLADGKLYAGDILLKPEVSHQLELGLDWHHGRFWASPRAFYRDIQDYIQGTPASDPSVLMIAQANGDPNPLKFSNVEASIYGFDGRFGARLNSSWQLSATLSYARGKRQDVADNLYRIAPFNGSVTLEHRRERWNLGLQTRFASHQSKPSRINQETPSPGYAVHDLFASLTLTQNLSIRGGVGNLLDSVYADHTSGINRVINSDIEPRQRVPANGRNIHLSLNYRL